MSISFAPTSCDSCGRSRGRRGKPKGAKRTFIEYLDRRKGMLSVLADAVRFFQQLLTAVSAVRHEQNGEEGVPAEDPEMPWKANPALKQRTFDGAMPPLRLPPTTSQLTILDKKLLEHISKFYSPLISNISPKFVLWTRGIQE